MSSTQVTPATTRHHLLSIPREIRDEIYLAVLQSPSEPPPSPENAGSRFARSSSELARGNGVFYPTDVYSRYACQSLQACNHQMNTELREVLAHYDRSGRGLDFRLDLMIQNRHIWPTWTLLPGPVTHIRNLEVEMRLFDSCQGNQCGGDGDPGSIFRPLFHMLYGIFHHGPQFVYKGPFERQLRVDTMVFTICRGEMLNEELCKSAVEARSPPSVLSMRRRIVLSVWLQLRMIASRGTLLGKVSKIKLNTGEDVKEVPISDRELAQSTVKYWDSYGYHWGVKAESDDGIIG